MNEEIGYTEQQLKSLRGMREYDYETLKDIIAKLAKENKKLKDDIQYLKTLSCDDKTEIIIRGYRIALTKVINHIYSSYENKKDFFEQWGNELELTNGLDILKEV